MLNKKDNLVIFVLALLVMSLAVFVMTGNIDLNKNKKISIDKKLNISINNKTNKNQNTNKIVNNNTNKNQNTNQNINQQVATTTDEIDTSDWRTYRNEEYRFEVKYPNKWYWEDYTEEFKYSMISFYPDSKKRGFDYLGDIKIRKAKKDASENIIEYFKKVFGDMPYMHDKAIITKNNYSRDIILIYDVPGYIKTDQILVNCDNFVISFNTPFGIEINIMKQMANELLCW
ncbi:hypothetical protein K8R61_02130 [bacterium]|nr:hypothetical protein [bacterium]